jgi:hypothetical protein
MNARHGQTPIPLPTIVDDPRWIGRFSREVRKSIAALRDRRIVVSGGQRAATIPTHPWKASVAAEDEVSVAAGSILIPVHLGDDENDRAPIVYVPSAYAGGTVEVTESGWLYAVLEYASENSGVQTSFFDMSDFASPGLNAGLYLRYSADVDVIFSTSEPVAFAPTNTHVYWPIAEVDVTDDVLTIVQQVLTHNPTHELLYIGVASSPTV